MNLQVDVQSASAEPVPDEDDIRRWIAAALAAAGRVTDSELPELASASIPRVR